MHKILSFYNSNRRVIWIAILAIAFTIILLQTLNNDAKKRNSEINTNDEINSSSNTTIYPNNQEDFLSSNYNSEKIQDEKLKLISAFLEKCNNGKIKEAYDLLSTDCKEEMFPVLEKFKNDYTDLVFNTAKTYDIKLWMSGKYSIYKISIYENALATGVVNNNAIDSYYTVVEENNDYKIIDLTVANNKGWLVVVYDPSDVHIMKSRAFKTPNNDGKENIIDMTKRYGATIGVNGGGFYDDGKVSKDIPFGYIIENGKVIYKSHSRESDIIGMSNDNKLMLVHATGEKAVEMGMRDGLEFGPFLIIDGKRQTNLKPTKAARNMIAQRDDGIILFLVTDGLSYSGITFNEGIDVLEKYGATTAANLDGGASTQLVVNGELLNSPKNALGIPTPKGRTVVNGWGVFID